MTDENDFTDSFVGDFVNDEPAVFKGLTDAEIKTVALISLFIGIPIGIVVALLTGVLMLALPAFLIMPIINVYFLASWIEKKRRGKPVGYVEHQFSLALHKYGIISAPFICETYKWGLGRTMRSIKKNEQRNQK